MWWLRLGIQIERIAPGHPQQHGRHERMHLALKKEATKPAAPNVLQQQARFDKFVTCYNQERPHQALAMKVPADLYLRLTRNSDHRPQIGRVVNGRCMNWWVIASLVGGYAAGFFTDIGKHSLNEIVTDRRRRARAKSEARVSFGHIQKLCPY